MKSWIYRGPDFTCDKSDRCPNDFRFSPLHRLFYKNQVYKNHQAENWPKIKNVLRIIMRLNFFLPYKILLKRRILGQFRDKKPLSGSKFKNHLRIFQDHFRHFFLRFKRLRFE